MRTAARTFRSFLQFSDSDDLRQTAPTEISASFGQPSAAFGYRPSIAPASVAQTRGKLAWACEATPTDEAFNGMTDHPRFEPVRSAPDQAYLGYHGGRLVNAVLGLVDWWRVRREWRQPGGWRPFNPADAPTVRRPAFVKMIGALPTAERREEGCTKGE